METSLWNLFHDGAIQRVEGSVPGDVSLFISIPYLRDRFAGDGHGFFVDLVACTCFAFEPWEKEAITNLATIASYEPEILDAELGDPLEVRCCRGMLYLSYDELNVRLDSGRAVQVSELASASEKYWQEWSIRANRS